MPSCGMYTAANARLLPQFFILREVKESSNNISDGIRQTADGLPKPSR
jgi:hypothetical protein